MSGSTSRPGPASPRHLVRAKLLVSGLTREYIRDVDIRYLLGLAGYLTATLLALIMPLLTVLVSVLLALMFALGPSIRPAFAPVTGNTE